jgi:uncharacterized protein YegP (UPF0339 family)
MRRLIPEEQGRVVYRDAAGQWRWQLRDTNGWIIAESTEAYQTREEAEHGVRARIDSDLHRTRRRWALPLIVVICAGVFLPLGDATGGLNLLLAPLIAGVAAALLARHGRLGTRPTPIGLGCLAAALTFLTMLAVIFFVIAVWGI